MVKITTSPNHLNHYVTTLRDSAPGLSAALNEAESLARSFTYSWDKRGLPIITNLSDSMVPYYCAPMHDSAAEIEKEISNALSIEARAITSFVDAIIDKESELDLELKSETDSRSFETKDRFCFIRTGSGNNICYQVEVPVYRDITETIEIKPYDASKTIVITNNQGFGEKVVASSLGDGTLERIQASLIPNNDDDFQNAEFHRARYQDYPHIAGCYN